MRWFSGITDSMDMSLSKLWETAKDGENWYAARHDLATEHNNLDCAQAVLKNLDVQAAPQTNSVRLSGGGTQESVLGKTPK